VGNTQEVDAEEDLCTRSVGFGGNSFETETI
jgi:hypothetical protein